MDKLRSLTKKARASSLFSLNSLYFGSVTQEEESVVIDIIPPDNKHPIPAFKADTVEEALDQLKDFIESKELTYLAIKDLINGNCKYPILLEDRVTKTKDGINLSFIYLSKESYLRIKNSKEKDNRFIDFERSTCEKA